MLKINRDAKKSVGIIAVGQLYWPLYQRFFGMRLIFSIARSAKNKPATPQKRS